MEKRIRDVYEEMAEESQIDRKFYSFAEDCFIAAERVNCTVVFPNPDQLQVDLDSEEAFEYYCRRANELMAYLYFTESITLSKSGLPHRHVTITVPGRTFTDNERVALQVMLGSDPVREGLNAMRILAEVTNPIRFFEPKRGESE